VRHGFPPVEAAGWRVVEQTADTAREVLADRLGAVYAIGSLAHGGFAPAISDVDVAVLTSDGRPTEAAAGEIARRVGRQGIELSERLSVFHAPWVWLNEPRDGSRFPAIDRMDLLRHGLLVTGADERERYGRMPAREEVCTEAIGFFLDGLSRASLVAFDPTAGVRPTTKVVLAPVRLWHVARTGLATSNEAAVDNYLTTPGVRNARLVRAASDWRRRQAVPDRAVVADLLDEHLLDLYVEVLELVTRAPTCPSGEIEHALDDLRRGPGLA
jgi:hypothetical protein